MVRLTLIASLCYCVHPLAVLGSVSCESDLAIYAADPEAGAGFGNACAAWMDRVVVGAQNDDSTGLNGGAAYVYRRISSGWIQEQKLIAPDGETDGRFGAAVAMHGNILVVGASLAYGVGRAYVFERSGTTWIHSQTLVADAPVASGFFGAALSFDGDRIVVGAKFEDDTFLDMGAVYVYAQQGTEWVLEQRLTASDAAGSDYFGQAVGIDGDVLAVGAHFEDDGGVSAGAVYTYAFATGEWEQSAKILAPDAAAGDQFGHAIALQSDQLIIGAPREDEGGSNAGAVYAFEQDRASWQFQRKLLAPEPAPEDAFGWSLDLRATTLLVGAYTADAPIIDSGAVFAFHYFLGAWTTGTLLGEGTPSSVDSFGIAVALAGDEAIVGAPGADEGGSASGAAYWFDDIALDCDADGISDPCAIASGLTADCNGTGTPDSCDIAEGDSADLNRNGVPDECEPDCNANEIPDDLDIASGASFDCNENEVPDECESVVGASHLQPRELRAGDGFGTAVAIDSGHVLIGTPYFGLNAEGAVFAYEIQSGQPVFDVLLQAPDSKDNEFFGTSVGVSGDVAVIGAPRESTIPNDFVGNTGTVRVYRRIDGEWVDQQLLFADDATQSLYFGSSVAIDGNVLVVGALGDDSAPDCTSASCESGAAYVFEFDGTTWLQTAKLIGSMTANDDRFGEAVAVDGDAIMIGVSRANIDGVEDAGSAYIFRRIDGRWMEESVLTMPEPPETNDRFGTSVDIQGDLAVVGATGDRLDGVETGSVTAFQRKGSAWMALNTFASPQFAAHGLGFGSAVGVYGNLIAVGAPGFDFDDKSKGSGISFVFARQGDVWLQESVFLEERPTYAASLGDAIGTDGALVVVGAPHYGNPGSEAYVLPLLVPDCDGNGVPDACELANGTATDADGDGILDQCELSPADVDRDGDVDGHDLALLLAAWGSCSRCAADLSHDGIVNGIDLAILLGAWG